MTRSLCILLLTSSMLAPAQEQGGRDVTIALFSTRAVRSVTITPLQSNSWTATCASCQHQPLTQVLHVSGTADLYFGGAIRVSDDASQQSRSAAGLWHIRATAHQSTLDIVLTLPSERYVEAVLNAEAAPKEPAASLAALAILARTYALNSPHFSAPAGHLGANLCDSTACQAMRLVPASTAVVRATRLTAGETLWFGRHRAEVYFSQDCGGVTESAAAVWTRLGNTPYLQSHPDPYCLRHGSVAWQTQLSLTRLYEIAAEQGWHFPQDLIAARVVERTASRRALRLGFTARNGTTSTVSASALRFAVDRALGWNQIRSDAYELTLRNNELLFEGRGHGHGVGLCQVGAMQMATEGHSTSEILAFYLQGTSIRVTPHDTGWQNDRAGDITIHATYPVDSARKTVMLQTWQRAQQLFPLQRPVTPTVIFAPTTEIFRQLAAQPGFALAGTQGSTIVLQPESVLRANKYPGTLLHEMLHVAVESVCTEHTPLWLREGLVEVLASEPVDPTTSMTLQQIDIALRESDSLAAGVRAHHAAAVKVKQLMERYGASVVRSWLSSGVPASIT